MLSEGIRIIKGTDKEIIAKYGNDNIVTVPYRRLEEQINQIILTEKRIQLDTFGSHLNIRSNDLKIALLKDKYYHVSLQFNDELPWTRVNGIGNKLSNIYGYSIELKIPGEFGPMTGYINKESDKGIQFLAAYDFGTKLIQGVLQNKQVKEEIRETLARTALKNSYFKITNEQFLKIFGRLFI